MPAACMIGMAVRDQSPRLRLGRIDPSIGWANVNAFGKRLNPGTQAPHQEIY
jgi:hypothetical protein